MFKESNKEVEERFLLTRERIEEIAAGENNGMNEKIQNYFKKTAQLLKKCAEDFVCISSDVWKSRSFEQLKSENALFFRISYLRITDILLQIRHLQCRN